MNPTLKLCQELIEQQRLKLLKHGRRHIPTLTQEDMLQPNDYQELEFNPEFRYEEGLLAGLFSMQAALQTLHKEEDL